MSHNKCSFPRFKYYIIGQGILFKLIPIQCSYIIDKLIRTNIDVPRKIGLIYIFDLYCN